MLVKSEVKKVKVEGKIKTYEKGINGVSWGRWRTSGNVIVASDLENEHGISKRLSMVQL